MAAARAGLSYVTDGLPGISRRGAGKGWAFYAPDGARITDPAQRKRITSLVIPPAWTDVWICPDPNGHIQATARDARGRKQYRYHPSYREARDKSKFRRILEFSEVLPDIRDRVERDLRARDLSRRQILATVVQLLDRTLIRVGNDEYARENRSFGSPRCADATFRSKARHCVSVFAARAVSSTTWRSPTAGSRASSSSARTCPDRNCSSSSMPPGNASPLPPTTSMPICG
jgi:hypothetical protein